MTACRPIGHITGHGRWGLIRIDTGDCPGSHMDDGSHSDGWQDGDWCVWCGDKQDADGGGADR